MLSEVRLNVDLVVPSKQTIFRVTARSKLDSFYSLLAANSGQQTIKFNFN